MYDGVGCLSQGCYYYWISFCDVNGKITFGVRLETRKVTEVIAN